MMGPCDICERLRRLRKGLLLGLDMDMKGGRKFLGVSAFPILMEGLGGSDLMI